MEAAACLPFSVFDKYSQCSHFSTEGDFEGGKTKVSPLHWSFSEPHREVNTGKHISLGTRFTVFLATTLGMWIAIFNYCHSKGGTGKGYVKQPQSSAILKFSFSYHGGFSQFSKARKRLEEKYNCHYS